MTKFAFQCILAVLWVLTKLWTCVTQMVLDFLACSKWLLPIFRNFRTGRWTDGRWESIRCVRWYGKLVEQMETRQFSGTTTWSWYRGTNHWGTSRTAFRCNWTKVKWMFCVSTACQLYNFNNYVIKLAQSVGRNWGLKFAFHWFFLGWLVKIS